MIIMQILINEDIKTKIYVTKIYNALYDFQMHKICNLCYPNKKTFLRLITF